MSRNFQLDQLCARTPLNHGNGGFEGGGNETVCGRIGPQVSHNVFAVLTDWNGTVLARGNGKIGLDDGNA